MTIQQVLLGLDGRPDLYGVRPSGRIISLNNRGRIFQHGSGKAPHQFVPLRSDLMTDDWQVKSLAQLNQEAELAKGRGRGGRLGRDSGVVTRTDGVSRSRAR